VDPSPTVSGLAVLGVVLKLKKYADEVIHSNKSGGSLDARLGCLDAVGKALQERIDEEEKCWI
jgi:hypothetical protein